MKKVLVYGTGSMALDYLPAVSIANEVIGFVDSDPNKRSRRLLGLPIYHPSDLNHLRFDEIILASSFADEIKQTLAEYGYRSALDIDNDTSINELRDEYRKLYKEYCERPSASIPSLPLEKKHIDSAKLIKDRAELLKLLPRSGICAELGVAEGSFTAQILAINKPKKLHLVDVWQSERYHEGLYQGVCAKFETEIAADSVQIHRQYSIDAVREFPDQYFDWIYIDTTHSYELTKVELELYAKKIKKNGIIAGHDYTMGNWKDGIRYGVMESVHEFCVARDYRIKYLTMDLVENQSFAIEKIT